MPFETDDFQTCVLFGVTISTGLPSGDRPHRDRSLFRAVNWAIPDS